MVLPDDVQGHWVEFNHAGHQPDIPWHPEIPISSPSAIVKQKDVAFPWEPLGDHMGVVQADELAEFATSLGVLRIIRSNLPDDIPGVSTDDGHEVRVP